MTLVTADFSYDIAMGTANVPNSLPNIATFSYTFTPSANQTLSSKTVLNFNNILVTYGGFGYGDILFGP